MKAFALTAISSVSSAAIMTDQDLEYIKYVTKFQKLYESVEEFEFRKQNFIATLAKIEA